MPSCLLLSIRSFPRTRVQDTHLAGRRVLIEAADELVRLCRLVRAHKVLWLEHVLDHTADANKRVGLQLVQLRVQQRRDLHHNTKQQHLQCRSLQRKKEKKKKDVVPGCGSRPRETQTGTDCSSRRPARRTTGLVLSVAQKEVG